MKSKQDIAKELELPGWAVSVLIGADGSPIMASMWKKDIVVSKIKPKRKKAS